MVNSSIVTDKQPNLIGCDEHEELEHPEICSILYDLIIHSDIDIISECVNLTKIDTENLILKTGERDQIDILIEEMSELTKSLIKMRRSCLIDHITNDVCKEFVHVNISLAVLRQIIARQDLKNNWKRSIKQEAGYKEIKIKIDRLGYSSDPNRFGIRKKKCIITDDCLKHYGELLEFFIAIGLYSNCNVIPIELTTLKDIYDTINGMSPKVKTNVIEPSKSI